MTEIIQGTLYRKRILDAIGDYCKSCNGAGKFTSVVQRTTPIGLVRDVITNECTTCHGTGVDPFS